MKKNLRMPLAPMVAFALVLGTGAAMAALTINNPSFESDVVADGSSANNGTITSWSANVIGGTGGNYGLMNPINDNTIINTGTVNGNNVAYVQSQNPGTISATIHQDIGQISQSGSTPYTLTLLVGDRKDLELGNAQPTIRLLTGSSFATAVALTATSSTTPALVNHAGNMVQWSFNYTIPASTDVWIDLTSGSLNGWVAFDNVQIVAAVPEPVNVALAVFGLCLAGGGARRWALRRTRP
jgi:hypothetical protein